MASDEILEFLSALKSHLVWCVNKGVVLLLELRYWIRFHLTMGIYALRKHEFLRSMPFATEKQWRVSVWCLSKVRISTMGARKTFTKVTR